MTVIEFFFRFMALKKVLEQIRKGRVNNKF